MMKGTVVIACQYEDCRMRHEIPRERDSLMQSLIAYDVCPHCGRARIPALYPNGVVKRCEDCERPISERRKVCVTCYMRRYREKKLQGQPRLV